MILDTTIQTPEIKRKMADLVGEPYGFIEKIRLGGVGSRRMRIAFTSEHFSKYMTNLSDTVYCNLELRKKGTVIHFKKYQTVYSWLIPDGKLRIKSDAYFTFQSDYHSLTVLKDRLFAENENFLKRLNVGK